MNTYYFDDEAFMNTNSYANFINENPSEGYLKIRAYAANQAVPIQGVNIVVSKIIDNNKVIFFDGSTNESGLIEDITLPAPKQNPNDLDVPNTTSYDITATYNPDDLDKIYKVNIYEALRVIQNIIIVPSTLKNVGGNFGG